VSASSKPSFGFSVSDIQPGAVAAPREAPPPADADRVAERLGFTSRGPALKRKRRMTSDEPTDQLNLRAAIADINRFVEWCERNRYSYREGFAELVKRLEA
jgi:hypothetical protein